MDDREILSAMRTSGLATLAGLAGAYDRYAAPLYSYCCWLLGEPDAAAEVVRETFPHAVTDLRGFRNAGLLCAHLYAVARAECRQRLQTAGAAASDQRGAKDQRQAGLEELIRDTVAVLDDEEREVAELMFNHGLSHTDLAIVLGVSRNRASAIVTHVRGHLEDNLALPIVAYMGAQACPELRELLPAWDGHLTQAGRDLVESHIGECLTCEGLRYRAFHPAIAYAIASSSELPAGLRSQVIALSMGSLANASHARRATRTASGDGRAKANAFLACAVVAIWVVAAVCVTLLTFFGSHS